MAIPKATSAASAVSQKAHSRAKARTTPAGGVAPLEAPTPNRPISPDYLAGYAPELFPWYKNRVQDSLQKLAYHEAHEPQQIVEIMHQIAGSNLSDTIMSAYTDHHAAARGNQQGQNRALYALLARFYVAGSLHRLSIVGDEEYPVGSLHYEDRGGAA